MFDPQPKPQFHTYPLRTSQLSKLNTDMLQIDQEIYQNKKEIQQINKKIKNQLYQNAFVQRLLQKNRILALKRQQLEHINKMHQYHQQSQDFEKKVAHKMNSNLANEYKQQIQQNQRKKSQQKQLQKQKDRQMMEKNQIQIQRIERQKKKQKQFIMKINRFQNDGIKQRLNKNKIQQRQSDKQRFQENYNKIISQPTDKQLAFQQFYNKNNLQQKDLQKIFNTSTQPLNLSRQNYINEIQTKNKGEYNQNLQTKYEQETEMKKSNRQSLKQYLQNQIYAGNTRKTSQYQHKIAEDTTRKQQQVNNQIYEQEARQKAKLEHALYSSQLAKQYNEQVKVQKQNSYRSHQHSYLNASNDSLFSNSRKQLNSPDSPRSGLLLGHQKNRSAAQHNPLTNPIPFSIGMTNPYILKQYENKRTSSSFRGSNLAQLGDKSFRI